MMPTRLAVGLEPLNVLDAAHRSPRSAPHSRAGFSSLLIILAFCAVAGLVGINYIVIRCHSRDGGAVYSAAISQGLALALVAALLLVADLPVTAPCRGWSALAYATSCVEHIIW